MSKAIEKFNPEGVHAPAGGYVHVVKYNGMIFLSGQFGFDEEGKLASGAEAQAMQVFKNIKTCLEAAGATLDDVLKVTMYVAGLSNKMAVIGARDHFLEGRYPASTLVFTELAHDYLVTADVIAAIR